jgi:DinB family protein
MGLKEELTWELEDTRQNFHHLLDSIPEALYLHPSDNPAWTIGDVLYHITLGPIAIRFEIWMIRYAPGLIQFALNNTTSKLFNWINAPFARRGGRINRQRLIKAYEAGHAGLISSLKRVREEDFSKAVNYPAAFVSELAGVVTVERLFRYVKLHFDVHAGQIRAATTRQV